MGRLKKAIIKQIQQREPSEAPCFIVNKEGDLVRYIPQTLRKPVIHNGTFRMSEVWPQPKN